MKGIFIIIILVIIGGVLFYVLGENNEAEVVPDANIGDTKEVLGEMEESSVAESDEAEASEVTFDVEGVNFAYDVKEIRVKEGDSVTINFKSVDGFHDVVIDEFSAATDRVGTGGTTSVTFVADAVGEYEYYCSVGNHRAQGMVGKLIVE